MKPVRDKQGRVIGLIYRGPRMDTSTTLSEAQVRSRLGIYQERQKQGNKSRNVTDGIDYWTYALGLFHQTNQPGEGAAR